MSISFVNARDSYVVSTTIGRFSLVIAVLSQASIKTDLYDLQLAMPALRLDDIKDRVAIERGAGMLFKAAYLPLALNNFQYKVPLSILLGIYIGSQASV
jgi:hypothetical protein